MNIKRLSSITVFILLALLAVGIRLQAARDAYPACGDSGHFVQHGVALANGVPGAMSTYWSQGMIAIAAGAVKMGLDPRRAMQATTLVAGLAVVLLFAGVIWRLTSSKGLSLVGGLVLATNPTMVQYSITGYSEMPYMALLMAGVWVALSPCGKPLFKYGLAGALIGTGGYFKGLDAAVAACGLGLFVLFQKSEGWRRKILHAGAIPAMAFIVLLPLCVFTYLNDGSFTPGSKGGANFALGADWADSKVVYAADGLKIEEKTAEELAKNIPVRVLKNIGDTIRLFNQQIFCRGLRMGTIWFSLIMAGVMAIIWHQKETQAILPLCLMGIQLGLLWLVFVHSRILAPTFPWLVLLILVAGSVFLKTDLSQRMKYAMGLFLLVFAVVNTRYALDAFTSEFVWWRYSNIQTCAKVLKAHGGTDEAVIMGYGPHLAVEFNKTNPLKTVRVPYGTIEQVAELAERNNVRFIVISDSFRSHWPVAKLFEEGMSAPENWILLEELVFPEEEWTGWRGHPGEKCRIYERMI